MDKQKIKSIIVFFILTAVLFYFGNTIARESSVPSLGKGDSGKFLQAIAVLDTIQFDHEFINSLGQGKIRTNVYIPSLSPDGIGRDNPFIKHGADTSFERPGNTPLDNNIFRNIVSPAEAVEITDPFIPTPPPEQPAAEEVPILSENPPQELPLQEESGSTATLTR